MYVYPKLREARRIAIRMGLPMPESSQVAPYKLEVMYRGRLIRFGHRDYEDFLLHKNETRRANWRRRMRGVLKADGKQAYKDKTSPLYWAWHLLW